MSMRLLSIIVPIYNVEKYLIKCLTTIIDQTYSNLEIILVDDGSTDHSGLLAEEFANRDRRITVIHKENGGLVSARKCGLTAANGDFVAYVDSDDWIESNMFEEMMQYAIECNADIVTSGSYREYKNKSVFEPETLKEGVYRGEKLLNELLSNMVGLDIFYKQNIKVTLWSKIFKTELLQKYQFRVPNVINVGEDSAVVFPCLLNSSCIYVSGKNYYHYRIRQGSVAVTRSINEIESLKQLSLLLNREFGFFSNKLPNAMSQSKAIVSYNRLLICPETVVEYKNGFLYPYSDIQKEDRIILYGAGRYGKKLYQHLIRIGAKVVAICDMEVEDGIVSINDISKLAFDKILIGVLKANLIEEIINKLLECGIERNLISTIDMTLILQYDGN